MRAAIRCRAGSSLLMTLLANQGAFNEPGIFLQLRVVPIPDYIPILPVCLKASQRVL